MKWNKRYAFRAWRTIAIIFALGAGLLLAVGGITRVEKEPPYERLAYNAIESSLKELSLRSSAPLSQEFTKELHTIADRTRKEIQDPLLRSEAFEDIGILLVARADASKDLSFLIASIKFHQEALRHESHNESAGLRLEILLSAYKGVTGQAFAAQVEGEEQGDADEEEGANEKRGPDPHSFPPGRSP